MHRSIEIASHAGPLSRFMAVPTGESSLLERREFFVIAALLLFAMLVRLVVLELYVEQRGDGPTRAMQAYMWSQMPVLWPNKIWLPGYIYLTGLVTMLFPEPLMTTRIFNVVVGTATVPVFYLLIRKLFDRKTALISAGLLCIFPLHVWLSATSMTEASFIFELLASMLVLSWAISKNGLPRLIGVIVCTVLLGIAALTRYEAWILLPLFAGYYLLVTRNFWQAFAFGAALALFPIYWMILSYTNSGSALVGPATALFDAKSPISIVRTMSVIGFRMIFPNLGYVLPVAAALGMAAMVYGSIKRNVRLDVFLYLLCTLILGMVLIKFTYDRGGYVFARYFLPVFVLILPVASWGLHVILGRRYYLFGLVLFIGVAIPFGYQYSGDRHVDLNPVLPPGIESVAIWLSNHSTYRQVPILMTGMGWEATYLPLFNPDVAFRYQILTEWLSDPDLMDFIGTYQPRILITRAGDEAHLERLDKMLKKPLTSAEPVYSQDAIVAYDMLGMWQNISPKDPLCVKVGPGFQPACGSHLDYTNYIQRY